MKRKQFFSQEQEQACGFQPFQEQRQHVLSILGGSGYQRGMEATETGINIEQLSVRYYAEVNEHLQGITGETVLTAKSQKFARDITANGETNNTTGWMAFTLIAAPTIANDVATFGDGTGTILMDEATETQGRSAWRAADFSLSSFPNRVIT